MAPPSNPKPLPALAEDVSDADSLHSVVTALAATIITTVVENKSVTSAAKTHIVQAAEEIRKAISMHAKLPASSAPADSLNTAPAEDAIVTSVQQLARSIASVNINSALHTITGWGKGVKLSFSPAKTQALAFSAKAKQILITMDSHTIHFQKSIKFLGVILDDKLNFREHINHIVYKATKIFNRLSFFCRHTWGAHPENIRIIYLQVIQLNITYAAGVWGHVADKKCVRKKLLSMQRAFALKAIRGFRTVSTSAALALSLFTPLNLKVKEANRVEATRLTGSSPLLPAHITLESPTPPHLLLHPAHRHTYDSHTFWTQNEPLPALAEDVSDAGSLHSVVTALAATIITTVVENKSVTSAAKNIHRAGDAGDKEGDFTHHQRMYTHCLQGLHARQIGRSETQTSLVDRGLRGSQAGDAVWTKKATIAMTSLYKPNIQMLKDVGKKSQVLKKISEGLKDLSIKITADQVKWKFNRLNSKYKECVDNNKKSEDHMTFEYCEPSERIVHKDILRRLGNPKICVQPFAPMISDKCFFLWKNFHRYCLWRN
ncbi:TRAS3 protein [Danaus plexippus plexippus]|uniref:TRAS3 protein n=1 Tax=Danaus plexippus plexippus TaxID=278856 RepID=A0A212ER46_DANPL|nr:TRAS3 protein [Danaus plexippus plexippus]